MESLQLGNPFTEARVVSVGTDPAVYHAKQVFKRGDSGFVMSRTDLVEFAMCPHRWVSGYKEGDTSATEWGSLMDCWVLNRNRFDLTYAIAPATYMADGKKKGDPPEEKPWNRNSTICKEWEEAQKGKLIIKAKEFGLAKHAAERLYRDIELSVILANSAKQVMATAVYPDPDTGLKIPIKVMIDLVPRIDGVFPKALMDLKTTNCAACRYWAKQVFTFGYDVQAALYLDVYTAATGEDRVEFRHIIQESFEPFEIGKRVLSASYVERGRMIYTSALRRYCQCLESGVWPGYDELSDELILGGWPVVQLEDWMMREM